MRRTFARSSRRELSLRRRREPLWLVLGVVLFASCSPMQAEVGSDLPPLSDAADVPVDARADAIDAGVAGRCDRQAPIRLYDWNLHVAASSSDINYIVKVENATGVALSLMSLKVRYYFTNELTPPTPIDIFYTDTCCSNKITDFNADILTSLQAIPATPSANAYLEIAFAPSLGSLATGDAVQVELAFHDVGYMRNLTQSNDYSYAATAAGTQAQWDSCPGPQCDAKFTTCLMTVHRDDALVWGTPP